MLIGSVVAKRCTTAPDGPGSVDVVAPLDTTCQSAGAVTVTVNRAFRSGWSKQAKSLLASAVSNWEYR